MTHDPDHMKPIHIVSPIQNITDRKRSEVLTFHMAHHDILVNLQPRVGRKSRKYSPKTYRAKECPASRSLHCSALIES